MISKETYNELTENYPWTSWAIWDADFPGESCIERKPGRISEFIAGHLDQLTTDTILLGINRSADLPAPCANFHAPSKTHYDYRLKEFIQDGDLECLHGAFMTDLVDEVDPDQSGVAVSENDARVFFEQLALLEEEEFHVVCFGNKPFDALTEYFGVRPTERPFEIREAEAEAKGHTLRLYRVWFYGLYGIYESKVDTLKRQLGFLNNVIG